MKYRLARWTVALWLAWGAPALASQATLVTPGSPLPMTGLATFLNAAFLSIGSCNSGNSAPTNGPGTAAFAGECWINTTANPWVFSYTPDGTHWSEFGTLNTSTFVWTPYSNGSALGIPITVADGGTNATSAGATAANNIGALAEASNLSDLANAATAMINLFPAATRAGDIIYWNGSIWQHFAGNNSGTQFFSENASGVPAWATASGSGTVTSVATGNGLSGGPISSTGTLTANVDGTTIKDGSGPLVVQNTTVGGAPCTPGGSCTPESISGVTTSAAGSNLSASVANYFWAFSSATEAAAEGLWPVSGTFKNFYVNLSAAPGTGKSYIFTLDVNGSGTGIACTVSNSATSCNDTTHTATITAGQTVDISAGPSSTPTVSSPTATLQFQTP